MMKKVMLVVSLFVLVDRVMYHKLGQRAQDERYAQVTLPSTQVHELVLKKKKLKERFIAQARALYKTRLV